MQILYRNKLYELISEQQKDHVSEYYEDEHVGIKISKRRRFRLGKHIWTTIYVHPDEILEDKLSEISDTSKGYTIAKDFEQTPFYYSWKFHGFTDGMLRERYTQKVYDNQNRKVAIFFSDDHGELTDRIVKDYYLEGKIVLDPDTNELDYEYDENSVISFNFKSGSLEINPVWDGDRTDYSLAEFTEDWLEQFPFMTQDIIDYFTNKLPLIPPMEL